MHKNGGIKRINTNSIEVVATATDGNGNAANNSLMDDVTPAINIGDRFVVDFIISPQRKNSDPRTIENQLILCSKLHVL